MKWTKEQQAVIDLRGKNLLVSAAAGSGKTAVLVARIIAMLTDPKDPVSVDRLIIMTFTRAAAEEMRERIASALRERISAEPDNAFLRLQKAMLPRAKIATIDSICQNLVKQYYQNLEIDPGFRVPEEGELNLLRKDILDRLLEEYYQAAEPDFMRFAEVYGKGKTDKSLAGLIERTYHLVQAHPWPLRYLKEQEAELLSEENGEIEALPWMKQLFSEISFRTEELLSMLSQAEETASEPDGPAPYLPGIEALCEAAEELSGIKNYAALYAFLKELKLPPLKPARNKEMDPEKKELAKAICDHVKEYFKFLKETYAVLDPEALSRSIKGAVPDIRVLIRLTAAFTERFAEKKREKNLVDFGDMEHLALSLLYREEDGEMKPSALADELAEYYREILIDEYQDSNFVQEALIQALSAERLGRPDVFMVGDVKQSIYRFRLAKPELFTEKYRVYESCGEEDGLPSSPCVKIELNRNFRSRKEVLSGINEIFFRIMSERLGGVRYDEAAALHPGADCYPEAGAQDYRNELLLIEEAGSGSEFEKNEAEALLVAKRINELVRPENPEAGLMVFDRESGGLRPARYSDIVILSRAPGSTAEQLVNTLSAQGIPAYTENASGYFKAVEIETMLALLSVIDNPRQDIPLAAVLRSPIGAFSDEELARLRGAYRCAGEDESQRDGDLFAVLTEAAEGRLLLSLKLRQPGKDASAAERLCEKARLFCEMLSRFREYADFMPVHRLLFEIFRETRYDRYVQAMPLGKMRRQNLQMLTEKAQTYGESSYHGLSHFVRYIESLKKYDTEYGEASAVSEQDEIVRILSIHKSKGLEYPVVILFGADRQFNRQDMREPMLIDTGFGIGSDYTDLERRVCYPGLKRELIRQKVKEENLGEELRVLYVALTRAREKLIITARVKDAEKKLEKWRALSRLCMEDGKLPKGVLLSAGSYLDFILMSLDAEKGCAAAVSVYTPEELLRSETDEKLLRENRLSELLLTDPREVYDEALSGLLSERFATGYPHPEETRLAPKKTVTEIRETMLLRGSLPEELLSAEESGQLSGELLSELCPEAGLFAEAVPAAFPASAGEAEETASAAFSSRSISGLMEELSGTAHRKKRNGASRGNAYHRVLELLSFDSEKTAEEQIAKLQADGRITEEAASLVEAERIETLRKSRLGQLICEAERRRAFYRERRFMIGLPARQLNPETDSGELQLLQGIIDAYLENEDGTLTLIDYKTDSLFGLREEEAEQRLLSHYRIQLLLYAKALRQLTGKPVSAIYIYSTALSKAIRLS